MTQVILVTITPNLAATTITVFDTPVRSVALSPKGAHLFYAKTATGGEILGQCVEGQFYNSQLLQCEPCNPSCSLCMDGA